ncbi:TPA: MucBP domain-containing protein [Streptococcus suis]|nr:MucBP domain-containing protein [Streptococcus suis]
MFKKSTETKGHGSIRKTKAYGAVAVLSLFGVMAAANGQTVSANEIPTEGENITSEASDTSLAVQAAAVEATVTEVAAEPVVEEPAVETAVTETPVVEAEPVAVETVAEAVVAEPVAEELVEEVATEAAVAETVAEGTEVVTNADTTVTVETTELSTAIIEAQAAGVKVRQGETVNLGTATTEQEASALQAEAESKQAQQAQDIQDKTAKYLEEVAQAQKNTTKDGYLSRTEAQELTLLSEPQAKLTITGSGRFANKNTVTTLQPYDNEWTKALYAVHSDDYYNSATTSQSGAWIVDGSNTGRMSEGYAMVAREGDTIIATYDNLQNSSLGDIKITKAVYEYQIKEVSDDQGYVNLVIYKDPTVTIDNDSQNEIKSKDVRVTLTPKYFDENGNQLDLSQYSSLISVASLNYDYYAGQVESVQNLNGVEFIPITGSTIKNTNGVIAATSNNSWNTAKPYYNGVSDWDTSEWDISNSPNEYYGAGVLKVTSKDFSFDLVSSTYSEENDIIQQWKGYWQAVTSHVKAAGVITKPTAEYKLYSYDVAIPDPVGLVVVDYKDEDGNTIKERVTDTPESPVGTNYNTTDNKPNKITTTSGKTYIYKTVEGNEAGKVVEGETKVTYIYSEVFGDVIVDYQDKNGNTISPREVDTPSTSTGTNYDTTDNKPVTIVTPSGKTYRIDTTATKGNETGKVVEGTTQVIYVYDEVLGNVVIDYKDTAGNTLKVRVTDTPDSSTGTAYDTTDNKPKEIEANGTVYRIKPELTVGQETGKVVEGTTLVTYVYDVVKGTVTVNYHDEDGNPIKPPVTDTPESPVKTPYDTTDNKPKEIKTEDGKSYRIIPNKTTGKETGEVVEGDTPVIYVYKEIKGDVIVDYKDKNGNTIKPRVTDTPESSTGTPYDTTDHKIVTIVTPEGKTYRIDEKVTKGNEKGKVVEGTTQVVYIYDEVLGSVIVHYEDEGGNTIKSDVVDTPDSSTNTPYDTGDNKPKTIVTETGRTYELVPGLTRGVEVGRVVEGKTHVTYVYKELFGNVLVNYVDEEGNIIKPQVEDTPQTSTGVAYSTLDNKPNAIKSGDKIYNIIPGKTVGQETGKIVVGTTEVTYVYKVVEAEPVKVGKSDSGINVDGKVLLAGSTINYEVSIDNDQFKGIVGLTEEDMNTPLIVIEDHDDKTTPVTEAVRVVLAEDKTKAQSGFTTTLYTSLAEAPKVIQDYIAANNISVNGQFSATVSDDAVAYNTNYVLTGTNLTLIFPAKINEDVKDASEIKNTAYQLDFSGAHVTNVVTNTTPNIDPQKDVTFTIEDGMTDKNSLNGKEVTVGEVINFELKSSYYPANRAEPITELAFSDTWSPLVSYDGSFKFFTTTDLLLKDGSTIAEGTEITKYVSQVINYEGRTVRYSLNSDFLGAIALESPLQVAGYMQVTVEGNGTVENTFVEIVNGVENFSNTVTVEVPTPPAPEKPEEPAQPTPPQPTPPAPETPVTPASVVPTLPNTGEENSSLSMAGMAMLVGMGAAYGVSKRRRRSLK